jgi:hypothetical protein
MKGLQVTKKVRTYEKVRKMYEATKKVRSYEKGPKLRKKYEKAIKRLLNSYERPWLLSYLGYEISNRKLRNIRPSEGLLTGSDRKRPLSEVCSAHALFSPALFSV